MAPDPVVRPTARVLLLDDADRVLMFCGNDPADPGSRFWYPPGGGIEPGETPEVAARREVLEETGHTSGIDATSCRSTGASPTCARCGFSRGSRSTSTSRDSLSWRRRRSPRTAGDPSNNSRAPRTGSRRPISPGFFSICYDSDRRRFRSRSTCDRPLLRADAAHYGPCSIRKPPAVGRRRACRRCRVLLESGVMSGLADLPPDLLVLTDAGLETVLAFHDGMDLPAFAAFPLLDSVEGRAALALYLQPFVQRCHQGRRLDPRDPHLTGQPDRGHRSATPRTTCAGSSATRSRSSVNRPLASTTSWSAGASDRAATDTSRAR